MFGVFINHLKIFNGKKVYAFITNKHDENLLKLFTVNSETEELEACVSFPSKNIKDFVDGNYLDKNVFQAIIVDIFDVDVAESKYESRYEFRTALKAKLDKLEIPNYFLSTSDVMFSTYLIATGTNNLQFNDIVLSATNFGTEIRFMEFKFTAFGYEAMRRDRIDINQKPDEIRQQIFGSSNPKKIFGNSVEHSISMKKFIKSKKLIIISSNIANYIDKFIVETCKWMFDKSLIKYHILPFYQRKTDVRVFYGSDSEFYDTLYFVDENDDVPFEYNIEFPRTVFGCTIVFDKYTENFRQNLDLNRDGCHRFQLTLSVDAETLESFTLEKVKLDEIRSLPYKLGDISGPKLPVIGFFDNSSLILLYDKFLGYDFLKSWNGLFGKDLFMSFDRKKQKYFEDAWKKLEDKNTFVVFDLIKIMSMPPENIQISKTWGFTITKDSENPVLLEFDNFDGTKKAASPSFLMAVLLRKHLKAIEEEIGEKPKEISFWIYNEMDYDEQFDEDEMKRIKEGLEESCKLLKISCNFVDV